MRVLINALFLIPNRVGGSETYLRGLVNALVDLDREHDYILCIGPEARQTFTPPTSRWRLCVSPRPSSNRAARLALEQLWLPRVASSLGVDLIHSAGYTAPLASRSARVTSIHDMNYKRHPEDLSLAERVVYSTLMPLVARTSHRIATLSSAARADILRWTGAPATRVVVVQPGARTAWPGDPTGDSARLAAAGVTEPFVLTVAASYPHKNLHRLVQAVPLPGAEKISLVIVGLRGRAHPALEALQGETRRLVRVLGWVDDALLASLYRRAVALAFPSLYEGFGLPILEAMALGTPVVTSNFGAMAEVAGGAAELVNPYEIESIRGGLARLASDPARREELRRLGLERAAQFTWASCAQRTLEVYSDALVASGRM